MSTPETATVGRVVHFHAAAGNGHLLPEEAPLAAIVTGAFEEGTVDLFLLPTRYTDGVHLQGIRHDDDPADEPDDPGADGSEEARAAYEARPVAQGSWGWPPRA